MPPLTLMIKPVSGLCNMRCKYCFYADVMSNRAVPCYEKMTPDTLEALVRRALGYADGCCTFAFQGGEPTLAGAAFYQRLLALERKYNVRGVPIAHSIQTNGLQLDDELLGVLKEGDFLVGVSLDGTDAAHDALRLDASGHGASARVRQTLERLARAGLEYNILAVVSARVAEQPEETFRALSRHKHLQFIACMDGFDGEKRPWSLEPRAYGRFLQRTFDLYERAFYAGRFVSVRNFDNYLNILSGGQPESCAMRGECGVYYLIEGDGSVYPCDFYVLDEWRLGNVRESNFLRLAKSPVGEMFRAASRVVDPACAACPYVALCRGGCRRDREPFEEGGLRRNRWCQSYKMLFDDALERMRKMAAARASGR